MAMHMNFQTGPEFLKECTWKTFSEDICILRSGGHVKNFYMTDLHLFMNKMNVHFNMLSTLMLNWVFREINGEDIITIHNGGFQNWYP